MPPPVVCQVRRLGLLPYAEAWELQKALAAQRAADAIPDTLLLLEHPPTYTIGRSGSRDHVLIDAAAAGIELLEVDRGGDATYHGPGQLVGYPIMRTDDVLAFVRAMERAIVAALAEAGVEAGVRTEEGPDFTGVWAGDGKIASIGVHVQRGVTTHGFAVNVDNDLTPFEWIVPCGLPGVRMTSLGTESVRCFRKRMGHAFAREHGVRQRLVSRARLEAALGAAPIPA